MAPESADLPAGARRRPGGMRPQRRGMRFAEECHQDLRYAVRTLRRQPGFSVAATVTLALALGLAVGLFAVVDAVLLQPLPFANQDELVVVWEKDDSSNNPHVEVSLPNFEDWRAQAGSFVDMAAMGSTTWGEVEVQEDPPVRLTISAVSASFFDTLGAQPLLGRTFLPEEDGVEAERVMVLSHAAWRQYFEGDPDVVGSAVPVGARREPFTVVGVGVVEDARYREIERGRFGLYVPFTQVSMGLNHLVVPTEDDPARLAAALRAEVRRADPNLVVQSVAPLRGLVDGAMRPWRFNMTMATLLAGLALGLAAVGLFSAVAYGVARRTREIGVRRALGAQAFDVLRLVWGQALALTLLGAAVGLGVALAAAELLRPLLFGVAPREAGTLAALTALLLAVCGAASLLAAWRATRIDPLAALRESD